MRWYGDFGLCELQRNPDFWSSLMFHFPPNSCGIKFPDSSGLPSAGLCSLHSTTPVDFRDHGGALGILGFVMAITTGSVQVNWNVEIFMLYGYIYYSPVLSVQEYEWLEYFAGLGNLTKCMKSAMYKSARFELLDNLHPEHYKSNFMDLNSASGFAPLAHNFN